MRTVLSALTLLVLVACGGDATAPKDPRVAVAGTYLLTTVNDGALPATYFQNSAGRVEIAGGSMVMRADGSFTETLQIRTVYNSGAAPQTSASVENGTFTVVGSQVTFSEPGTSSTGSFSWTGAVSGNVVTYTYGGIAFRYQK